MIAELFLDGRPLFTLSQLLGYRRGLHDPSPDLAALPPDVAALVKHMTQARRLRSAAASERACRRSE